ncbi:MAG: SprT family zinc-dependent metalloprotease [Pseudomonadota bacterium]
MQADPISLDNGIGTHLEAQLSVPDPEMLTIQTRSGTLPLLIVRGRRRSMGVHIFPDRPAELRLPFQCPTEDVVKFLRDRWDWIDTTVRGLPAGAVHPQQYHDGAILAVFGKPRSLTLLWGRPTVALDDSEILVYGRDHGPAAVEQQLGRYFSRLASEYLPPRLTGCHQIVSQRLAEDLPEYTVSVRKMKAAWGRCRDNGHITLNSALVQKSTEIIDLVLIHELCHLLVMDHSARFKLLMDRALPDWRRREALLSGCF